MLTLNDGRSELWQWDTNRKLTVDADCSQVHFSNKVFGRSIDVDVVDGVATIPDILLQTDKELTAWAFAGTAEDGYTKISKTFKVNKRNKPADYVFTPIEQMTIDEIAAIAQSVRDDADAGLFNGENGVSATHEWNGTTLSITSASGTSSANLKGDKGDKGGKGDPFTYEDFTEEQLAGLKVKPVRGTDYWTEADKQEIVNESAAVSYKEQTLTDEQKAQARDNIGAISMEQAAASAGKIEIVYDNANAKATAKGTSYACFFEQSLYLKSYKPYFTSDTGIFNCRICETADGSPMRDGAKLEVLEEISANCGDTLNINRLITQNMCIWIVPDANSTLKGTQTKPPFTALIAGVNHSTLAVMNIENMRGVWWFTGEFVVLVDPAIEDINSKLEEVKANSITEVFHTNASPSSTINGENYACFFEQSHYLKTYKPYFKTNSGTFTCRICKTLDGKPMRDGAKLEVLEEITANCGDAVSINKLITPDMCIWVDPGSANMLMETKKEPTFKALIAGVASNTVKNIEAMRGVWWIAGEFAELVNNVIDEVFSRMDEIEDEIGKTTAKAEVFVSKSGGEYSTITEALSGYGKNSTRNILVDKGTYEEVLNVGIVDGLTIKGVSREHCVILNKTGNYKNAPITISGNFLIENLTLKMTVENPITPDYSQFPDLYPGYAIHIDSGSNDSSKENFGVVRNCVLYSEAFPAIGLGTHKNQTIILDNCILIRNTTNDIYKKDTHRGGLIAHAAGDENDVNQKLIIRNCVIRTNYGMTGNIRTDVGPIANLTVTAINNVFYSEEQGFDCFDFANGESMLDGISHGNTSSNLNSVVSK